MRRRYVIASPWVLFACLFSVFFVVSPAQSRPLDIDTVDSLWASGFNAPGVDGVVKAMFKYQHELFIGGDFSSLPGNVASVDQMVIWNKSLEKYEILEQGTVGSGAEVRDFELETNYIFGLVVAGEFEFVQSGNTLRHLAIFDDGHWETLTGDTSDGFNGPVNVVEWIDGQLCIGGEFSHVGSLQVNGFVIWDPFDGFIAPATLLDPDGAFTGSVNSISYILVDGDPILYVGGQFSKAGPSVSSNIARMDVTNMKWQAIPDGGTDGEVHALQRSSQTDRMLIGGEFTEAGGDPVSNLAVFDYAAGVWDNPPSGPNGPVYAFRYNVPTQWWVGGQFDSAGTQVQFRPQIPHLHVFMFRHSGGSAVSLIRPEPRRLGHLLSGRRPPGCGRRHPLRSMESFMSLNPPVRAGWPSGVCSISSQTVPM